MIINNRTRHRNISAILTDQEVLEIRSYLQGAVYCWCKNRKTEKDEPEWFAARDLFGGDNYYWEGTPLFALYNWHKENKAKDPVRMAGRDVGNLLRDVIEDDRRKFCTKGGYRRLYKWDGVIG